MLIKSKRSLWRIPAGAIAMRQTAENIDVQHGACACHVPVVWYLSEAWYRHGVGAYTKHAPRTGKVT